MSADSPAAGVYAAALLKAAGDVAVKVADELDALANMAHDAPETWEALIDPRISSEQRVSAIDRLYADAESLSRNFLKVLVQRNRLEELPQIAAEYRRIVRERENELDVHVTTAIELSDDLRSRLEERLSASTGKQVRLHATVQPDIIGGLVVQYDDTLMDTSLRGRLDSLRVSLRRGALRPAISSND